MCNALRIAAAAVAVFSTAAFAQSYDNQDLDQSQDLSPAIAEEDVAPLTPAPVVVQPIVIEENRSQAATGETLPAPRSDNDPHPQVALPGSGNTQGAVVRQAGVGGPIAYGRRGVVELGGSAAFTTATNLTSFSVSPSIGWFFVDNFEISAILGAQYSNVAGRSSTFLTALAEPSYHLPFSNTVFAFLGVGMGVGYVTDVGAGFALAPRLGMNFLIGRSGVLSPAAFLNYSTAGIAGDGRVSTLRVNSTYGAQIGYTVML